MQPAHEGNREWKASPVQTPRLSLLVRQRVLPVMEIARHFTSCLCVGGRIGLSIASLQVLSFLFTFFITAPSPFSWAPLNVCFRCAAPSFPLPFLICVSAGGLWCIHTEELGELAAISFQSSAALPFSLGLAVLTLTVRSTALLWALEAVVSSSECFGNSCLLCGERVLINLISLASGRLGVGFHYEVPSLLFKRQRRLTLQLRCRAARFLPEQTAGQQPSVGKEWHQRGVILPSAGDGDRMLTRRGDAEPERGRASEERKGATWWKWPWLIITQPASHTFLSQASEVCPPKTPAGSGAWRSPVGTCKPLLLFPPCEESWL